MKRSLSVALTIFAVSAIAQAETVNTRIGPLEFSHDFANGIPTEASVETIRDEMDFHRATQVYLWGMGPVSMVEWQREAEEKFGAGNTDLVAYGSYQEKLGIPTANATTPYLAGFTNLSETGPLVIEIPPGPTAGLVNDFWHRSVIDMGVTGPDKGKGAKYLIVGPGQTVEASDDYRVVKSGTLHIFWGTRILDPDPVAAKALRAGFRVYSYSQRKNPPTMRIINAGDDKKWLGNQPRGMAYWDNLAAFVLSEPVAERDRLFFAMLKPLGIEKGKPFQPNERQKKILMDAALVGEAMAKVNSFDKRFEGARYWEGKHWEELMMVHPTQRTANYEQLDERAAYQYEAFSTSMAMISKTPGLGQAYLAAYRAKDGDALDGSKTYRLRVPADVPAKNFWSMTIYDIKTRCLIDNPQRKADRSSRHDLVKNSDGSIDLYVGPKPPSGFEDNWVPSVSGQAWFCYFRLYGPTEAHFDRTWTLPDFEEVK
jgi:hypothetical protein